MGVKEIILYFVVLTAVLSNVLCKKEKKDKDSKTKTETEMIGMTYCACKCCEEHESVCPRPKNLPDDFKCDLDKCTEGFCTIWEKAKCQKDCFCGNCWNKLKKNDNRCAGFKEVSTTCQCEKEYDCANPANTEKDIKKQIDDIKKTLDSHKNPKKSKGKCNLPCFCKNCHDVLPPSMQEDCKKFGEPKSSCDCSQSEMKCPDKKSQEGFKEYDRRRPSLEAQQSIMTGKERGVNVNTPETEIRKRKCTMQCFCDKCGDISEEVTKNCKNMVRSRIADCNCEKEEIKCPDMHGKHSDEDKVDTTCQLSCFCNKCLKDKRMTSLMKNSCQSDQMKSVKPSKDCDCSQTNCDMLDKLAEVTKEAQEKEKEWENSEEAKKMKKGRMKKNKKKIWDEL